MASRRLALGLLVALAGLGLALVAVGAALRRTPMGIPPRAVLVFDAPAVIEESLPRRGAFPFRIRPQPLTVWQAVRGLRAAARDDRIRAVVIHVSELDWGWGKVAEVRDALLEVLDHDKPVFASLTGGSELEYLLASAAGTVACPEISTLQIDGLALHSLFLRGTLDKLGVTPNFAQAGRFKSGAETFTRSSMSEPHRLAQERLLDDEFALLVDSLAAARGFTSREVRSLIDEGPFTAREAYEAGLVDTLLYDDEVDSLAVASVEGEAETVTLQHYLARQRGNPAAPRVALVVASGTIVPGKSRGGGAFGDLVGAQTLKDALREARERRSVKAIVLRVDSPGGDGFASDDVWKEVERCRKAKPVVVSMGDLAASGGYYIAMGADAIVAQPMTLTGSIGVFGGKFNQLGLFRKLGLNVEGVSRGRHAEMFSPFRDFSPDEREAFQAQLDDFYRQFVAKAAAGRGLRASAVDSAGEGRVWSGLAARGLGLVDELGGLAEALRIAQRKAGLDPSRDVQLVVYPRDERTFLERFLSDYFSQDEDLAARLPEPLRALASTAALRAGAVWALMPYSLQIR